LPVFDLSTPLYFVSKLPLSVSKLLDRLLFSNLNWRVETGGVLHIRKFAYFFDRKYFLLSDDGAHAIEFAFLRFGVEESILCSELQDFTFACKMY